MVWPTSLEKFAHSDNHLDIARIAIGRERPTHDIGGLSAPEARRAGGGLVVLQVGSGEGARGHCCWKSPGKSCEISTKLTKRVSRAQTQQLIHPRLVPHRSAG